VGTIQEVIRLFATLPPVLLYGVLAVGSAAENVVPLVPADAMVVAGGVLAAHAIVRPWLVFLLTWIPNASSAVAVYFVARRYGSQFFKMPIARWLLREHQLMQVAAFYRRWGVPVIFLGRFLPGWRAVVPVFAGVSRASAARVILPLVLASAIWHAILVRLGMLAGRNLAAIAGLVADVGQVLVWLALALLVALGAWWWRTRHPREGA
jgi:membrane protein DedA with SNARE-associated domain